MNKSGLLLIFLTSLLCHLTPTLSQLCPRFCGSIPMKYPFGVGPGCGDPRFQKHIYCDHNQQLLFATHTGCYPVTSIDYSNQVFYITDPTMSSCFATQSSKGFSLDWDAPFTFYDGTVFALLGCSQTSSPVYKINNQGDGFSSSKCENCSTNSNVPQCDSQSAPICTTLVSGCQPISQVNGQVSTCCVYTPVDLGPTFEMDLDKLHCSSYTAVYDFDGRDGGGDPEKWKYGIAIKYKFNVNNDYPSNCAACESTHGACGYGGQYNSFLCNCPSGQNTTTDCWFESWWNHGSELLPWNKGKWLIFYPAAWLLVWLIW